MSTSIKDMPTKTLFDMNSRLLKMDGGNPVPSGKELMKRTNTSAQRCEQSNRECVRRREAAATARRN